MLRDAMLEKARAQLGRWQAGSSWPPKLPTTSAIRTRWWKRSPQKQGRVEQSLKRFSECRF